MTITQDRSNRGTRRPRAAAAAAAAAGSCIGMPTLPRTAAVSTRRRRSAAIALALALAGPLAGSESRARADPEGHDTGDGGATTTPSDTDRREAAPLLIPDPIDTPVEIVCQAAVALALAEPERARSFLSRARAAGWLPELRFRVYRRFARTEGLTFDDTGSGAVAPVDISAVDDVRYEWRATWDLSRMVFSPDEIQAHFEALRMAEVRRDVQTLVIRLYFERRRLVQERASGIASPTASTRATTSMTAADARASERRSLRISEIEAELDAMSGGAFSGNQSVRGAGGMTP